MILGLVEVAELGSFWTDPACAQRFSTDPRVGSISENPQMYDKLGPSPPCSPNFSRPRSRARGPSGSSMLTGRGRPGASGKSRML